MNCFRKEALHALKEAIMTSHEANDNVCLQHSLAWLYKLSDDNKVCLSCKFFIRDIKLLCKASDFHYAEDSCCYCLCCYSFQSDRLVLVLCRNILPSCLGSILD